MPFAPYTASGTLCPPPGQSARLPYRKGAITASSVELHAAKLLGINKIYCLHRSAIPFITISSQKRI